MIWRESETIFFHNSDVPLIKIVLYSSQVPPYEPRIFPLPDDVYEKMLKAMPEGHPFPPYSMAPKKLFTKDNEMVTSPFLFVTIFDLCEISFLQGKT